MLLSLLLFRRLLICLKAIYFVVIQDIPECEREKGLCEKHGEYAECHNSVPFYSCICKMGFITSRGLEILVDDDKCIGTN